MDIEILLGDTRVPARLAAGPAARAFKTLLPLTLRLTDYASAEKIADLPRKLRVDGEPPGCSAATGDICYYAPWGNIALFYKPARYANGLVHLGVMVSGADVLRRSGVVTATIRSA